MKRDTINYFAVGCFVLAMFGALGMALVMVTGSSGLQDRYHAYYKNVTGLGYGTPIYYEGYRVGQVTAVKPRRNENGTRYRVAFRIQSGWPIPEDSVAAIVATGILGDVTIQLYDGKSKKLLEPKSEIRGREGADIFTSFGQLATEVSSVAVGIRPVVDQLRATLGENGAAPIVSDLKQLMSKLNQSADGLNQMLGPGNVKAVENMLTQANAAASNTRQLTAELMKTRKEVDALLAQTNAMVGENRPDIQQSTRELRVTLQAVSSRIDAIVEQLDGTTRNMQEFSREIRNNPGRLIGGARPEDPQERSR